MSYVYDKPIEKWTKEEMESNTRIPKIENYDLNAELAERKYPDETYQQIKIILGFFAFMAFGVIGGKIITQLQVIINLLRK